MIVLLLKIYLILKNFLLRVLYHISKVLIHNKYKKHKSKYNLCKIWDPKGVNLRLKLLITNKMVKIIIWFKNTLLKNKIN